MCKATQLLQLHHFRFFYVKYVMGVTDGRIPTEGDSSARGWTIELNAIII